MALSLGGVQNLNRILYSGLKLKQCVSSAFLRENLHFVHVIYLKTHFFFFFFGKMFNSFESASTAVRVAFDSGSTLLRDRFLTAS